MGTNENSYGHALIQKSVTPSYENSVPRTHTPPKKIGFAPLFALLHWAKSSNFGLLPDIKLLIQGLCGPEKRRGKSAEWGSLMIGIK